jgi:predicted small lipoprotein YifL|tara:strand:+ start:452 stop:796 length:345 start_codon:yes stop_codon:yes gene_type:complete
MKNLFKLTIIASVLFILTSCGRMGPLIPWEDYVPCFNEIVPTKQSLTKLSDKELIMKARISGNYSDIEFGSDALDPDVPINEKELANREELIEVLIEPAADRCPDSGESTSSTY